ncbi:MAG: hypothetical protein ACRDNK_16300 [Solirubrobacteraceae bacterium]
MPRSGMSAPASSRAGFAGEERRQNQDPVRGEWVDVVEPPTPRPGGVPGRHTVTISGQGAEGFASRNGTRPSTAQRHSQVKRHERAGFRPDRVAMWAVMLGVTMMLMAAVSSHAAVLAAHHALAAHETTAHRTTAHRTTAHCLRAPARCASLPSRSVAAID